MQKIKWTLDNYTVRYYGQVSLTTSTESWAETLNTLDIDSHTSQFYSRLYTITLLMRGQFNPKRELKMAHEIYLDSTITAGFFNAHVHGEFPALDHPLYNFREWQQLTWEALAKKEFTFHCHLSLKSAKLKCVSNVTIYDLPSARMISHLGSTGWTSTLIHKTGKRERVLRSENATKREDLRCCTLDGSLRTTRAHAKNGNPFKKNKRMWRYSHTFCLDGLRSQ